MAQSVGALTITHEGARGIVRRDVGSNPHRASLQVFLFLLFLFYVR